MDGRATVPQDVLGLLHQVTCRLGAIARLLREAAQEEVEWVPPAEPLSAADMETLSVLGIDPADGAGAMRALACLIRVLNRRQAIDLDELAAEIRESSAASAAEVATSEGNPDVEGAAPLAGPRE